MIEACLALVVLLLFLYKISNIYSIKSNTGGNPPGPWKLPIIGHLPFIGLLPHETFLKWKAHYGPVMSIQFGSYPAVVINDGALIRAAFSLPSLSGRPRIKYLDDISRNRSGFVWSDGPKAKELRSFAQRKLKDFGYGSQSMEAQIQELIPGLLETLDSHSNQPFPVRHGLTEHTLKYLWSLVNSSKGDEEDTGFREFQGHASEISSVSLLMALCVFLPKLSEWFPGATGYMDKMDRVKKSMDFFWLHLEQHKRAFVQGQPKDLLDCFLDEIVSEPELFTKQTALTSLMELVGAGVETTASTLEWLIYYLVKYPDIQEKAREEIEANFGVDRVLCYNDRACLPYLEACIRETMRKSAVVPLSLYHSALEDTQFQGFLIKKDTMVVGNLYAAHNDPLVWEDPEIFRPERFLDKSGKLNDMDKHLMPFSTGKRKCIGENLARNQLFLFTGSILQKFRLEACGTLPSDKGELGVALKCEPFFVSVCKRKGMK